MIAFDHKLYALGKNVDGSIGLYKITVEEYFQSITESDDKRFHNLKYIEKVADDIGRRTFDYNRSGGSTSYIIATGYMISDFFELVKKYDEEFNQPCSFVVNEDGTPEVVYHGTGRADRAGNIFLPERATTEPSTCV